MNIRVAQRLLAAAFVVVNNYRRFEGLALFYSHSFGL